MSSSGDLTRQPAIPIAVSLDWDRPNDGRRDGPDAVRCLAVDASLDNRDDLVAVLRAASSASLEELAVRAYLSWGEAFVDRFKGDFAVVLWDERAARVVAARDPFGVRPLFYRVTKEGVRLSSDVSWILSSFRTMPALNDARILEYLFGRYLAFDHTFFRDVFELPPGHLLIAGAAGVGTRRYWHPPADLLPAATRIEDCHRELRRLFIESVRRRLRSDRPVAIHVSGGLDSSAIAGAADLVRRGGGASGPGLIGVAGIYPGLACDESEFITAVADNVGFPVERWDASEADPADLIDPAIAEPGIRVVQRGGTAGDIALAQKHGGSVILSGLGGDEIGLVAGVVKDMIGNHDWVPAIDEMFFFEGATARARIQRVKQLARQYAPSSVLRARSWIGFQHPSWMPSGASRQARNQEFSVRVSAATCVSHVQRAVWDRLASPQTARALGKMQIQALGAGVEYRFPFLDQDLVRFVLSIPYQMWPRPGLFARLHREPLRDLLPVAVANRAGKAEFTSAVSNRIRRAQATIERLLGQGSWASERYVDRNGARGLFDSLRSGGATRSQDWGRMWAIVALEAWLRRILRLQS